jgi:hypothetical protein
MRHGARAAFSLRVRRKAAIVGLPRIDLRKKVILPRAPRVSVPSS